MREDREMYCPHCGSPSDDNATMCHVCGQTFVTVHHGEGAEAMSSAPALAGWWRRVGATVADNLILVIPTLVVVSIFEGLGGVYTGAVAGLLLQGFYMVWQISGKAGQTVGNRVAASKVVDALTGSRVTLVQAVKRWGFIAVYASLSLTGSTTAGAVVTVLGLIDSLWPLFDPRKQTLHDKFAGTLVVRV
ncbi:MAG TPA: RDD family protein [Acidimicrobiales bacterium]|nr:RDD family protein [Acidimicrobiales bacterium]